jgi:hypothetical protein
MAVLATLSLSVLISQHGFDREAAILTSVLAAGIFGMILGAYLTSRSTQ